MKVLLVSPLAFLFAFFLGCQENSITDPVTIDGGVLTIEDVQNLAYKDLLSYYPENIPISGSLYDPSHASRKPTVIDGFVRYNHKLVKYETTKNQVRLGAEVKLYINSKLFPDCPKATDHKCMGIAAILDETVSFTGSNEHAVAIEKKFNVCNCCCRPLEMLVKFEVSHSGVNLVSIKLQLSKWRPIRAN
jgi:hypothetical protein